MKFGFHEENFILAEKTQSAGIANSLTGDTLSAISKKIVNTKWKILLVTISILITGWFAALSDFNPIFKSIDFQNLKTELHSESKELDPIVNTYLKIFSSVKEKSCSCRPVLYNLESYRKSFHITKALYELKMHKDFSHSECLRFELSNTDYLFGNVGVKDAANFYFSKSLNQLSEEEIIILIVMLDNPSLYNPVRNKEKVMSKVRFYQNLIHETAGNRL